MGYGNSSAEVLPGTGLARLRGMSGHNRRKKAGERKEKQIRARKQDFEQPIVGSVTASRADATSNFTDGDIAGGDWKHEDNGQLKRDSPVSEPRDRGGRFRG